jgi:hypothetical protein
MPAHPPELIDVDCRSPRAVVCEAGPQDSSPDASAERLRRATVAGRPCTASAPDASGDPVREGGSDASGDEMDRIHDRVERSLRDAEAGFAW